MNRFMDWDDNGQIDPTDIGMSVSYDNDDDDSDDDGDTNKVKDTDE